MNWVRDILVEISRKFNINGTISQIQEIGSGNINQTFKVTLTGDTNQAYILQQINPAVFPRPQAIIKNILLTSHHHLTQVSQNSAIPAWALPKLIPTASDRGYLLHEKGYYWRMMSYIQDSIALDKISSDSEGISIGRALAQFHFLSRSIDLSKLEIIIPDFHTTLKYVEKLKSLLESDLTNQESPEVTYCHHFFMENLSWSGKIEKAKQAGLLFNRTTHGDPKVSNILLHRDFLTPLAMIDLDTIQPGLIHYDLGDCFRSACNPGGETPVAIAEVYFDLDIFKSVLTGYLSIMGTFLSTFDCDYLFDSIRILTFELGVRFFTDYLEGNIYFKTDYDSQNLDRALTQFKLVEDILKREEKIRQIIQECSLF